MMRRNLIDIERVNKNREKMSILRGCFIFKLGVVVEVIILRKAKVDRKKKLKCKSAQLVSTSFSTSFNLWTVLKGTLDWVNLQFFQVKFDDRIHDEVFSKRLTSSCLFLGTCVKKKRHQLKIIDATII